MTLRRSDAIAGATFFSALLAVAPAFAQSPVEPSPKSPQTTDAIGRFSMTPVAGGFLRLDTRTGQTSLCTISGGEAQCRVTADERAALDAEIGRLAKENAELKAQAPLKKAEGQKAGDQKAGDEEERRFDRALDRAERFLRRMMQIFRDADAPDAKPPAL